MNGIGSSKPFFFNQLQSQATFVVVCEKAFIGGKCLISILRKQRV
jgi:hypothetical protein